MTLNPLYCKFFDAGGITVLADGRVIYGDTCKKCGIIIARGIDNDMHQLDYRLRLTEHILEHFVDELDRLRFK